MREIGRALVPLHELGAATQQRYFAFGIRGARAGFEVVLSQTRRGGLIGEQLFEQRERFPVTGNGGEGPLGGCLSAGLKAAV